MRNLAQFAILATLVATSACGGSGGTINTPATPTAVTAAQDGTWSGPITDRTGTTIGSGTVTLVGNVVGAVLSGPTTIKVSGPLGATGQIGTSSAYVEMQGNVLVLAYNGDTRDPWFLRGTR